MITIILKARYCYWHQLFTMNIHAWHSRDQSMWDIQLPLFANYARIMKTRFSLFFVSLKVQWGFCKTKGYSMKSIPIRFKRYFNTFVLVVVFQASYAISGFMTLNILNNYLGHETMVDSFISQRLPAGQSSHDDSTQGMSFTYFWLRQVLFTDWSFELKNSCGSSSRLTSKLRRAFQEWNWSDWKTQ